MDELTPRQRQVLRFIQDAVAENGMPPTRAEIARALGFKSANAAEEHLRALQRKGVLELLPGASRGIQLRDSLREQLGCRSSAVSLLASRSLPKKTSKPATRSIRSSFSLGRITCSRYAA